MNIILYKNSGELAIRYSEPPVEYAEIETVKVYAELEEGNPIAIPSALYLEHSEDPGDGGTPVYISQLVSVIADETLDLKNYAGYRVSATNAFPAKQYTCSVVVNEVKYAVGARTFGFANNTQTDEHNALVVNDRTITVVNQNVMLIAEDHLSQEITFLIKEKYDGISFLDDTKVVYVDFVPIGYVPREGEPAFFSDSDITRSYAPSQGDENWIYLRWRVPKSATYNPGNLPIALSVLGSDGYVWQTAPAYLQILPNIGRRGTEEPTAPTDPDAILTILDERVAAIEENYIALTSSADSSGENDYALTASSDDGDDEILLGGGDAVN